MSNMTEAEKDLSDKLDDLLVENKIETPRQSRTIGGTGRTGFTGFLITVKDPPRTKVEISMFPNETEEPHFKVTYQNEECRFKISDCAPMKAEAKRGIPRHIKKIIKEIKSMWKNNKALLEYEWIKSRPTCQNHGHQLIR